MVSFIAMRSCFYSYIKYYDIDYELLLSINVNGTRWIKYEYINIFMRII